MKKYITISCKFKDTERKGQSVTLQVNNHQQILMLLEYFDVALVCNNTFYPLNKTNYDAQFNLIEGGLSPSAEHDDNFEDGKKLNSPPAFPDSLIFRVFAKSFSKENL